MAQEGLQEGLIKNFAAWFKKNRLAHKLTQQDVANLLFVTPQAVSKWERGDSFPDIMLLPDIGKLYGMSISDMFLAFEPASKETLDDLKYHLDTLISNEVFEELLVRVEQMSDVHDLDEIMRLLLLLNEQQQTTFLHVLFGREDYNLFVDEIIPYLRMSHRAILVQKIIEYEDYYLIESIISFLDNNIKTMLTKELLAHREFEVVESILPFLTFFQHQVIFEHIKEHPEDIELLDSLYPFIEKKED